MTYLHGYTEVEAARLRHQALHLAPYILFDRPLAGAKRILEVGSGVGGQTAILVGQYPESQITAVERERSSHDAAARWLQEDPELASRVDQIHADVRDLPDGFPKHDAAFFCWVLEHCPEPIAVLKATLRHLAPGARVLVHEVFNQSFDIRPSFPKVVRQYYDALNALQRSFGGDPNVGSALGQYLFEAGFTNIQISTPLIQLDDREPKAREAMFNYMGALFRSAEAGLLQAGVVPPSMGQEVEETLRKLGCTPGVTFHYNIVRATAEAPG
ncbi:MAG: methyltransferase domain-containing protein [Polyangiaceae bacterium]|nr:methyltransferase domain-containing protein [Polyangiaceae bacterium]